MRDLTHPDIDRFRLRTPQVLAAYGGYGDEGNGVFQIMFHSQRLYVIASDGGGWDHVSVSAYRRCPTWDEMSHVHRMFIGDLPAMQLHVPIAQHVNVHPHTLHLWRPQMALIPLPPLNMV